MPFTFSHPAIVFPIKAVKRRLFSTTGLVTGSMVPDFEFFLNLHGQEVHSHHWPGLFYYDLPLALVLTFVFHNSIRNPLINHLPAALYNRVAVFTIFHWNRWFRQKWYVVILSILIGVVTHFLWDSFTHEDATMVNTFPVLQTNFVLQDKAIPVYILLQYVSSLIGLLIVAGAVYHLPVNRKSLPKGQTNWYWGAIGIIALLLYLLKTEVIGIVWKDEDWSKRLGEYVIIAMAALLAALTLVSMGNNLVNRYNN